jgi:hypothetical protein
MSKKVRRGANIDEDQAVAIEALPDSRRLPFSAVIRLLLDEALTLRQGVKLLPSQVTSYFDTWGREKVHELALACIKYLEQTGSSESDQFLKNLHEQRRPSEADLVLLAERLNIPVEKLMTVVNCFFQKEIDHSA